MRSGTVSSAAHAYPLVVTLRPNTARGAVPTVWSTSDAMTAFCHAARCPDCPSCESLIPEKGRTFKKRIYYPEVGKWGNSRSGPSSGELHS